MYPKLHEAYDKAKADTVHQDTLLKVARSVIAEEKMRKLKESLKPREFKIDPKTLQELRVTLEKTPEQKDRAAEKSVPNTDKINPGQLHDAHVKTYYESMKKSAASKLKGLTDNPRSNDVLIESKK